MSRATLQADTAGRIARLALECVHREFPNHPLTVMLSDDDVRRPQEHSPAFFGCFDWHSAVHGHWTLVRLIKRFPDAEWAKDARAAVRASLTKRNLDLELRTMAKPGREGFERPYGLAWLLQLAAEVREWEDVDGKRFVEAIEPLEHHCRDRLADWLTKLTHPIRSGEHSQTAFAMGLAHDWAAVTGDQSFTDLLCKRARIFYANDIYIPLRFEPSGHDFLSPALAEADLMRRVLSRETFPQWLDRTLPSLNERSLFPNASSDPSDGKLAHLDGLNLSRAWMLDGIASALDEDDARQTPLRTLADRHAEVGLHAVTGEHYAGGHWLGTFATYLMTRRGMQRR